MAEPAVIDDKAVHPEGACLFGKPQQFFSFKSKYIASQLFKTTGREGRISSTA